MRTHFPAAFFVRTSLRHELRVETLARPDGEVMRSVGTLHHAEVDGFAARFEQCARRAGGRTRQVEVAGEHLASTAGHEAQRGPRPGDTGRPLHRRAVAPVADDAAESDGPPSFPDAA